MYENGFVYVIFNFSICEADRQTGGWATLSDAGRLQGRHSLDETRRGGVGMAELREGDRAGKGREGAGRKRQQGVLGTKRRKGKGEGSRVGMQGQVTRSEVRSGGESRVTERAGGKSGRVGCRGGAARAGEASGLTCVAATAADEECTSSPIVPDCHVLQD